MKKDPILVKLSNTMPIDSVFRTAEHETIAENILVILKRTKGKFRKLSWKEYKKERLKDGNFWESEKKLFDQVIEYTYSAEDCARFSSCWVLD